MMFLFLLLVTGYGQDPTPLPTVPTPYPTITPAPESDCSAIADDDAGPFVLDCLQAQFITAGCSVRGHAYPTETSMLETAHNKGTYNDLANWLAVKNLMKDYNDGKEAGSDPDYRKECLGDDTDQPTPDPTALPTTLKPTPAPTIRTTDSTPAPVYADDSVFKELFPNENLMDGTSSTLQTDLKAACIKSGYQRQYDETEYVIQMSTDGGNHYDYYTTSSDDDVSDGNSGGICELMGDYVNNEFYWSDRHDGPFQKVTVDDTDGSWTIGDSKSDKQGDQRVFPRWYKDGEAGGYGSPSSSDLTAAAGLAFEIKIAAKRNYQPCRERIVPQETAVSGSYQGTFTTRCQRKGTAGQDFNYSGTAEECDSTDNRDLLYAIANNQFATCDANCIYSLDYDEDVRTTMYWHWQVNSNKQCWMKRTDMNDDTWNECDTKPKTGTFKLGDDWKHIQREKQMLCKARCDYANGWILAGDTCYQVADASSYTSALNDRIEDTTVIYNPDDFTTNPEKGVGLCNARLNNAYGTATQASINSKTENLVSNELCNESCYFCGLSGRGTETAKCEDNKQVTFTDFLVSESDALKNADGGESLVLNGDAKWKFMKDDVAINVLCAVPAKTDDAESGRVDALACMEEMAGDGSGDGSANQKSTTKSFPELVIANSGFVNHLKPGDLRLEVTIPKTMYNVHMSFENSTNDAADYNWQWDSYPNDVDSVPEAVQYWEKGTTAASCDDSTVYQANIPWTVFNLGGAGGVQRLDTYELEDGESVDTEELADGVSTDGETYYQFGSVIRLQADMPLKSSITSSVDAEFSAKRVTYFERTMTVRMPFILRFQKTITVDTDVNIISTKFNYKTVAAIIQSIQHSTQYFAPPYAKLNVQIRTKSQYPYMFKNNKNAGTAQDDTVVKLHRGDVNDIGTDKDNTLVNLELLWLVDDVNCTFTNPDHMREGDICVQEWMLKIEPKDTVCYATGEYSLQFTAKCFDGKDVCYYPKDSAGDPISTVTFTFKIQTSKFCPVVADEVDLTGSMAVTGRNSFKPDKECTDVDAQTGCVENDTAGSFYMQGETIHLLAETQSTKATISATEVVMIELEQDLSGLVQTGYNRVPWDESIEDVTVWTKCVDENDAEDGCQDDDRVSTGKIKITTDDTVATEVTLVKDDEVFPSGSEFNEANGRVQAGKTGYTFASNEAGFKILLHARAFPVNVDSFGSKTLVATLAVEYTDLAIPGDRRRRLLTASSTDTRTRAKFMINAFEPKSLPAGLSQTASLALVMTLEKGSITRTNAHLFAHSMKEAIRMALNEHDNYQVYDSQVSVDRVKSNGVPIWQRTTKGAMHDVAFRRLESGAQTLITEITFANVHQVNAMPLKNMIEAFERQIKSPSSPLMHQPVFYGAIVHSVEEIKTSTYSPPVGEKEISLESSAFALIPCAFFALLSALL